MLRTSLLASAAVLVVTATAAAQTADTTSVHTAAADSVATRSAPRPRARPARYNVIAREEMADLHLSDAYQLIQRLRPGWLTRLPDNPQALTPSPVVYFNGNLVGGLGMLREYTPQQLTGIRFYPGVEARARFGPGAAGGAIAMTGV
ncbi:MAG TPA: hypothetical protein VFH27_02880 [Longimicrobiaceae bacterium]|nr:hypothetical protein [Longimicrobiaceae bacterium]